MSNVNRTKVLSKKETRKIVFNKLSEALVEFKPALKERKLNDNLKKLSKTLAADIVKARRKQNLKKKSLKKKANSEEQAVLQEAS